MAEAGWGLRPVHPDRPVFSWWAEGRRWLERAVEGRRRANVIPRGARSGRGALAGGAGQFREAGDGGEGVRRVRGDVAARREWASGHCSPAFAALDRLGMSGNVIIPRDPYNE